MRKLTQGEWRERAGAHARRVDAWLDGHLRRRAAGLAHPVEDFLFTYYDHRPARLRRWHPGAGVLLEGARDFGPEYTPTPEGALLDTARLLERRGALLDSVTGLLAATAARPAHLACFGLHEWAMLYRSREARHADQPLRLSPAEIDEVVERRGVRCSHFDAFRFFTEPARPLNALQPTRARQAELEQPGCLHANMDLYKWAYRLSPLVSGELVADCFGLAREIRAVDMRASPYDLRELGYRPIAVESAEGRAEYVAAQRGFAARAAVLRGRLLTVCREIRTLFPENTYAGKSAAGISE